MTTTGRTPSEPEIGQIRFGSDFRLKINGIDALAIDLSSIEARMIAISGFDLMLDPDPALTTVAQVKATIREKEVRIRERYDYQRHNKKPRIK